MNIYMAEEFIQLFIRRAGIVQGAEVLPAGFLLVYHEVIDVIVSRETAAPSAVSCLLSLLATFLLLSFQETGPSGRVGFFSGSLID